jgi:hypothetical protein
LISFHSSHLLILKIGLLGFIYKIFEFFIYFGF